MPKKSEYSFACKLLQQPIPEQNPPQAGCFLEKTGTVTISNSAILDGTGSIAGAVNVNNTSQLAPGASSETLATGSLAFTSGTFFDVAPRGDVPNRGAEFRPRSKQLNERS